MATKTDPEELVEQIHGYGMVVIVAALMIFVTYEVVTSLVGQLPAQVGSVLIGLVGVYVFVVNRQVRRALLEWLRNK